MTRDLATMSVAAILAFAAGCGGKPHHRIPVHLRRERQVLSICDVSYAPALQVIAERTGDAVSL